MVSSSTSAPQLAPLPQRLDGSAAGSLRGPHSRDRRPLSQERREPIPPCPPRCSCARRLVAIVGLPSPAGRPLGMVRERSGRIPGRPLRALATGSHGRRDGRRAPGGPLARPSPSGYRFLSCVRSRRRGTPLKTARGCHASLPRTPVRQPPRACVRPRGSRPGHPRAGSHRRHSPASAASQRGCPPRRQRAHPPSGHRDRACPASRRAAPRPRALATLAVLR